MSIVSPELPGAPGTSMSKSVSSSQVCLTGRVGLHRMRGVAGSGSSTRRRGTFAGRVDVNRRLCDEHYLLTLHLEAFAPSKAGQFIQLQCRRPTAHIGAKAVDWPEGGIAKFTQPELIDTEALLRRPFSLGGRRDTDDAVQIDLIYRTIGAGTGWLAQVKPGEDLSILGPLGNAFPISREKPQAVLVGGGVGIPPMLYLAEALAAAGKETAAFCGARSAHLLPLTVAADDGNVAEFAAFGAAAAITTDDGSLGRKGFVTELLAERITGQGNAAAGLVVYACGPEPMMKEAAEMCISHGVECYLCLERYMACGVGTCQSCVVKIRDDSECGWSYKLCCTDGPVFDAREVLWD